MTATQSTPSPAPDVVAMHLPGDLAHRGRAGSCLFNRNPGATLGMSLNHCQIRNHRASRRDARSATAAWYTPPSLLTGGARAAFQPSARAGVKHCGAGASRYRSPHLLAVLRARQLRARPGLVGSANGKRKRRSRCRSQARESPRGQLGASGAMAVGGFVIQM